MTHIRDLTFDPRNARQHNPRNIGMIAESLQKYGPARSIAINENNVILAGNGVVEAATQIGVEYVRVFDRSTGQLDPEPPNGEPYIFAVRVSGLTPTQEAEYAVADNRTTDLSEWNTDVLAGLAEDGVDLSQFWFEDELGDLLADDEPTERLTDPDDVPDVPEEPTTKRGDVWLLGRHRLMCGDSTVVTDVDRLMGGQRAQTTFTDPPYNVGIDYGSTTNDKNAGYAQFSRDWFVICPSDFVAFTPGTVNLSMWIAEIERPKWVCVWRKTNQCSSSPLNGFNTWEPILIYGKHPKPIGHDSWDIPVAQADIDHPVPKTVEAWSTFLQAFSTDGSLVYDPFAGSGTTFISAEDTGRICYGIEINPAYCDVIVRRWEAFTGQTATLEQHDRAAD